MAYFTPVNPLRCGVAAVTALFPHSSTCGVFTCGNVFIQLFPRDAEVEGRRFWAGDAAYHVTTFALKWRPIWIGRRRNRTPSNNSISNQSD